MESFPYATGPAPWTCKNMSVRIRRENPTADTTYARGYERWTGGIAQPIEPIVNIKKDPVFMDMKPQSSRTDGRSWLQAPTYVGNPNIPLQKNPYFTEYDIASDPRNVGRELRGAVKEPVSKRGMDTNRGFLERTMESQYIPDDQVKKMVDSYSQMRPTLNDMKATFR